VRGRHDAEIAPHRLTGADGQDFAVLQ
jgi:hypothetical protein